MELQLYLHVNGREASAGSQSNFRMSILTFQFGSGMHV